MSHKSAPSTPVSTIGIDGKNSFHLVGLDQRGARTKVRCCLLGPADLNRAKNSRGPFDRKQAKYTQCARNVCRHEA